MFPMQSDYQKMPAIVPAIHIILFYLLQYGKKKKRYKQQEIKKQIISVYLDLEKYKNQQKNN